MYTKHVCNDRVKISFTAEPRIKPCTHFHLLIVSYRYDMVRASREQVAHNTSIRHYTNCNRLFLTVAVPIVASVVLWLVHVMPAAHTPWHVKASVALAWFTALSCLILMPLDVARAYSNVSLPPGALPTCWLIVYWWDPSPMHTPP